MMLTEVQYLVVERGKCALKRAPEIFTMKLGPHVLHACSMHVTESTFPAM